MSDFYMQCNKYPDVKLWPAAMQQDTARCFHVAALNDINIFDKCLKNHSLPWCLGELRSHHHGCGIIGQRLFIGLYYIHLHKWMQFYPKENFLLLRPEDMLKEPHRMMTQISDFLGVDPVTEDQAKHWMSHVSNVHHQHQILPTDPCSQACYETGDQRTTWEILWTIQCNACRMYF